MLRKLLTNRSRVTSGSHMITLALYIYKKIYTKIVFTKADVITFHLNYFPPATQPHLFQTGWWGACSWSAETPASRENGRVWTTRTPGTLASPVALHIQRHVATPVVNTAPSLAYLSCLLVWVWTSRDITEINKKPTPLVLTCCL